MWGTDNSTECTRHDRFFGDHIFRSHLYKPLQKCRSGLFHDHLATILDHFIEHLLTNFYSFLTI